MHLAVAGPVDASSGMHDVEVRMATGGATRPVRDDWTCTIRRDTDPWPGYIAENLFPSALVPVCTSAIASRLRSQADSNRIADPFLKQDRQSG